jgi:MFS family permease
VYPLLRESLPSAPPTAAPAPVAPPGRGIDRNVLYLGLTSLITDISAEMVHSILPVYLVFQLRLTPLQFGLIDGLYQGVAAVVRLAGGLAADRWRRYKEVAASGYALSAVCKLGFLAVGEAWLGVAAVVLLDRLGKGVRTAPRDALISLSSARERLATAFGVHRTFDSAGAMLGPLVAFGLLALVPSGFDVVFMTSFCLALIGLAVLLLFVENRSVPATELGQPVPSTRAAIALLANRRFGALVAAGTVLGLATISDGFVYLALQRQGALNVGLLPLLYVATAFCYFLLALPAGWLADRLGRPAVLVGGYLLLLGVYAGLLWPLWGPAQVVASVALLGAYYAATDGVLMALGSAALPATLRGSGLALLTTATSVARLLSSVLFGAIWTVGGLHTAVVLFAAGLAGAILVTTVVLRWLWEKREEAR